MKSLVTACTIEAETVARHELMTAGIDIIKLHEAQQGELAITIMGKLADISFNRSHHYWCAKGRIPLAVAELLYADPVGRRDLRIGGYYERPSPDKFARWFLLDGRQVLTNEEMTEVNAWKNCGNVYYQNLWKMNASKYIASDDPASIGAKAFIGMYHADSQEGLNLLARMIKKHMLDEEENDAY